jgi:hypothetical protein
MKLTPLGELQLAYTRFEFVDYGVDGQHVGTLEGRFDGIRLSGALWLVNTPRHRADGANEPCISGLLLTDDGARMFLEMRGVAVAEADTGKRRFTTSLQLRCGEARYAWVNDVVGVVEGRLDPLSLRACARAYACTNELDSTYKPAQAEAL